MKKKVTKNKEIWLKDYPPDHAQIAYNEGYYVEAIQVLHCWIENKLQEMLLLSRHKNLKSNYSELWESVFSISLLQNAKVLFVIGKINKTTFDSIRRFNAMRNKIIHKLFHEDYNHGLQKVNAKEYDKAFTYGIKLSWKLEGNLAKLATRGKVEKR